MTRPTIAAILAASAYLLSCPLDDPRQWFAVWVGVVGFVLALLMPANKTERK